MNEYTEAISNVTRALQRAVFRDIEGDEIFKLNSAVSKLIELSNKLRDGDIIPKSAVKPEVVKKTGGK